MRQSTGGETARQDNRPRKRKPGFHEEMFTETSYYFRNGLRYVYPYRFKFVAHVKGRWLGMKVLDVFKKEFHMESPQYYEKAILSGKIRVNDAPVDKERILTQRDVLYTHVHRHEPPVIHQTIQFLENSDDMVVINKPSSIPVHPCGRYRHNTIVFLLGKEHGLDRLHTIHRIDRLTSGILMFAKTPAKAREMEQAVKSRQVEKTYLCRVVGDFCSNEIEVDQPILTVSHKVGVCRVSSDGKPCSTLFKKLSYNGKTSVVQCFPHTGRMHQIRVHLQWLGHPIVNDPIYNHPTAWGEGMGKGGVSRDTSEVIAELIWTRKDRTHGDETDFPETEEVSLVDDSGNKRLKCETKLETLTNTSSCDGTIDFKIRGDGIEVPDVITYECTEQSSQDATKSDNGADVPQSCITRSEKVEDGKAFSPEAPCSTACSSELADENCSAAQSDQAELGTEGTSVLSNSSTDQYSYTSRDIGEEYYDEDCTECQRVWLEPTHSELIMYLHAYSYKGPGWEYTTSMPDWSSDDFKEIIISAVGLTTFVYAKKSIDQERLAEIKRKAALRRAEKAAQENN